MTDTATLAVTEKPQIVPIAQDKQLRFLQLQRSLLMLRINLNALQANFDKQSTEFDSEVKALAADMQVSLEAYVFDSDGMQFKLRSAPNSVIKF